MAKTKRLQEAIDDFVLRQNKTGKAERTVLMHKGTLQMLLNHIGDIYVHNIKPEHIEDFFYGQKGITSPHFGGDGRMHPGVGNQTHNHYRSRIQVFHNFCLTHGWSRCNWLEEVHPLKVARQVRQQPDAATLLSFLELAKNPRDRAYIATAINTGKRSNELKALKVGQIVLEDGVIEDVIIGKTGDLDDVPITEDLDAELRRWLKQYAEDLGRDLTADDFLFPPKEPGRIEFYGHDDRGRAIYVHTSNGWIPDRHFTDAAGAVQYVMKLSGLETKGEGSHTLRRAVARYYFDQTASQAGDVAALRETAAFLNHKNLATTERYLGMTAERSRRDRRLKGKPFLTLSAQ